MLAKADFLKDCAAFIVAKKHTQRRYLAVYGANSKTVNYMWLDPDVCCWSTMAEAIYKFQYVHAVSLTKWEAYLMGGNSDYHGQSTRYNLSRTGV